MSQTKAEVLEKQAKTILAAAQKSGVEQNFLFSTTFDRYLMQIQILGDLENVLHSDEPLITKEYVKNRGNICIHPAINAYNKTTDGANRTATTLMKIITSLKGVCFEDETADERL